MSRDAGLVELGATVRSLRKARELTQAQLADAAGLTAETLSRIEGGKLNVTASTIMRLATALDVAPGALFKGAVSDRRESSLRPGEQRLLNLVQSLDAHQLDKLVRGLRQLLDLISKE